LGGVAELWGNTDFPIVFGRLNGSGPKTLIVYGMYDVQPAEEPNWISPPFAAEIHDLPGLGECVIARGAVNSKGALCGLLNALRTIKEEDEIPLNLIFTIEGEEEIGSPQLEGFIRANCEKLRGNGVIDFDFSQDSRGKVSMHLGLKGIVYLDLVCRGSRRGGPTDTSLHGSVSAWISSPVCMILLRKLEKTFDEKAFLREMRSVCFKYERRGVDLLRTGLYWPIINVNGFHAGYVGTGTKTVLPRKATAKIDIRFGPNMEPDEVIEKFQSYLLSGGFDDIEIEVRDSYTWSKTDFSDPVVQRMLDAYRLHDIEPEAWPMATWAAPYFVFSRILGLPVVSGGLGHGGRQHVANEYMSARGLRDFEKFVATFLYLMAEG
jgi:acetylornithine deacetylase/succinyl-diaminopimelate desuccinylase-like protein